MPIAKLIPNGGSQAVRLPKECRFEGNEVRAERVANAVVLVPIHDSMLDCMNAGFDMLSEDFMEDYQDLPLDEEPGL